MPQRQIPEIRWAASALRGFQASRALPLASKALPPASKVLPLVLAAFLGGCSGACITETVRSLQGGAAAPETPDFVVRTRQAAPSGHIPVGVTPPGRPTPLRNAADVQKLEKELGEQREQAQAFAHRPAPKSAYDGMPLPKRPQAAPAAGAQP